VPLPPRKKQVEWLLKRVDEGVSFPSFDGEGGVDVVCTKGGGRGAVKGFKSFAANFF
jgi:hypothetical protein